MPSSEFRNEPLVGFQEPGNRQAFEALSASLSKEQAACQWRQDVQSTRHPTLLVGGTRSTLPVPEPPCQWPWGGMHGLDMQLAGSLLLTQ